MGHVEQRPESKDTPKSKLIIKGLIINSFVLLVSYFTIYTFCDSNLSKSIVFMVGGINICLPIIIYLMLVIDEKINK